MRLQGRENCVARGPAWALLAAVIPLALAAPAAAFEPYARWSNVPALGFPGGIGDEMGDPLTLTWSIVPDGTTIPQPPTAPGDTPLHPQRTSSLNSFLNGIIPGGPNTWMPIFEEAFDRWSALSGIQFVHEANDDGRTLSNFNGQSGVRGDIRIGGTNMDGGGGTLAYSYFPSIGDMVLDTDGGTFLGNTANNYRRLRNTIMHEVGHGFGLSHLISNDASFLMEPNITASFDGPQLDDILGAHWYYGDAIEKTYNGLGNGTAARAWDLGTIADGGLATIGIHAGPDLGVLPMHTDFVSIDNNFDVDFYSFSIDGPSMLDAALVPLGGTYNQAPETDPPSTPTLFDANAQSNLALAIMDTNGTTQLAFANEVPAGEIESLSGISLPAAGQYYARVTGSTEDVQLYRLRLSIIAEPVWPDGDYNHDGIVGPADYTVWRNMLGQTGTGLAADGSGAFDVPDEIVDQYDYQFWKEHYGNTSGSGTTFVPTGVPEPATIVLAALGSLLAFARRRHRLPRAT